ncbi:hypothetical protein [Sporosarcina gallistercoris]|uniref:DUF2929 family protein n=1 Tax=Sporosarcina gallistercoris TaxID=2762245 RepID=A0ABR8PM83_9BACL|nr:hypothetical protein [Sporosarcina gallistercoris]MBD7909235.1 hypothetical protein [Sporosarcina gallistercoris]
MKILLMVVWGVILLYLLNVFHIEKTIFNYVIAFVVLMAGIFLIERVGKKTPHKSR